MAVLMLWAASAIERHSRVARRWVIGIGVFWIAANIVAQATLGYFGHSLLGGLTIFGFRVRNPSFALYLSVSAIEVVTAAVPIALLLTTRAVQEFSSRQWLKEGRCADCGYDLRGIESSRACPECGVREPRV